MTMMDRVVTKEQTKEPSRYRRRIAGPALTRRALLAGTGHAALLAVLPFGCAPIVGKPFADGTFWDDGSGWTS